MTTQFDAEQEQESKLEELHKKADNFFREELEIIERQAKLIQELKQSLGIEE